VKGQEAHQNGAAVHFTEPWQPAYDTEYWSGVRSGGLNYRQFQMMNGKCTVLERRTKTMTYFSKDATFQPRFKPGA